MAVTMFVQQSRPEAAAGAERFFRARKLRRCGNRKQGGTVPGALETVVLDKFKAIQMVDVHLPTTDGRHIVLPRYTQPEKDQQLLLQQMKLRLPAQPPPRITAAAA